MKSKRLALALLTLAALIAGMLSYRFLQPGTPKMNPPVDIQDGKTIDFSSGKPVVKDSAQEKAIIDAAVKEMDEAVKDVVFTSPAPLPAEQKAAPPGGAPTPQ